MSFSQNYDTTIRDIESQLSDLIDSGQSFDLDRRGDVLTIEFEDGEKIVITPQAPLEQLWISANYAGHRFNWSESDNAWLNEKGGERFLAFLAQAINEHVTDPITLS